MDNTYYYCKRKADGRLSTCKEVISISKDMVISAMYRDLGFGEHCVVFDTRKEYNEAKAKADKEYKDRVEKENEFHIEELTESAKKIYETITDEYSYCEITTKDIAKQYSLLDTKHKPYYVFYGDGGYFADYDGILKVANELVNCCNGHNDEIAIYDVKTGDRVSITVERISIGSEDICTDENDDDE